MRQISSDTLKILEFRLILHMLRLRQQKYVDLLHEELIDNYFIKTCRSRKYDRRGSRCSITKRAKSVLRLVGVSRFITKRAVELALFPGIVRASW